MDYAYAVVPFIAWLAAGSTKFLINSLKVGRLAFDAIGYGGIPSNHSAIVSSITALIAIRVGISQPVFGVAVAFSFVVILDAYSLRRQVGKLAEEINRLNEKVEGCVVLKERIGHTGTEIAAGMSVGIMSAWLVDFFFPPV